MKLLNQIYDIYEYLYYYLYNWQLNLWKGKYSPEISALFGPSILIILNIGVPILLIIKCFAPESISGDDCSIIIGLFFSWLCYYLFIGNNKYLRVYQKYKKESREQRKKNTRRMKLYVFFSILFAILFVILMRELFIA